MRCLLWSNRGWVSLRPSPRLSNARFMERSCVPKQVSWERWIVCKHAAAPTCFPRVRASYLILTCKSDTLCLSWLCLLMAQAV
jgi:hypothetical protein